MASVDSFGEGVVHSKRKPKRILIDHLPGTDTGPASHGMCSGADERLEESKVCNIRRNGLTRSKKF